MTSNPTSMSVPPTLSSRLIRLKGRALLRVPESMSSFRLGSIDAGYHVVQSTIADTESFFNVGIQALLFKSIKI